MTERSDGRGQATVPLAEVAGASFGPPVPAPSYRHLRDMTKEESVIFRRDVERTCAETWKNALRMLEQLKGLYVGLSVDAYEHSLQCATRAYRANASDEMVLVSLLHDAGKCCTIFFHEEIAAGMLKPFVSKSAYQLLLAHSDFQGRFHYQYSGRDPEKYLSYRDQPWFDLAMTFSAEWDSAAFDPSYDSKPLADFIPLVKQMLSRSRPL
jgi:predicted HD phosphohydrolase